MQAETLIADALTDDDTVLLLSKDTYQQLHTTDDSVYGVISDLLRDIAEVTEETGYLRFVMTEQLLVSGRHHALCAVDATRRALEDGHRIESVAALLETMVENVADTMDRIADRIARSLDEIEEQTALVVMRIVDHLFKIVVPRHRDFNACNSLGIESVVAIPARDLVTTFRRSTGDKCFGRVTTGSHFHPAYLSPVCRRCV